MRIFADERTLKSLEETLGLGPEVAPETSETSASGTAATRVASPGPQRPSAALVARQQLEYRLVFGPHIWDGDDEPVVEDEGRQPGTAALASPSLAADYLPAPAASSAASSGGPEGRQPEGRQPDDGDAEPPRKYSCVCVSLQEQRVPLLHPAPSTPAAAPAPSTPPAPLHPDWAAMLRANGELSSDLED